jgi:hypothetical protein
MKSLTTEVRETTKKNLSRLLCELCGLCGEVFSVAALTGAW